MADQQKAPATGEWYPCAIPNMRRLAADGVSFTNAIVPCPLCSPSRATFFTGLLPSFHGVYYNVHMTYAPKALDPNISTLAAVLKSRGYRTALCGVWHVSEKKPIKDYGFDRVEGYDGVSRKDELRLCPAETIVLPYEDAHSGKTVLAETYDSRNIYNLPILTDKALTCLRDFSRDASKPFFLFVSTRVPHVPWHVFREDLMQVPFGEKLLPVSFTEDPEGKNKPAMMEYNGYDCAYWKGTAQSLHNALRHYYTLIAKVDEQVGCLLEEIKRLGMEEDTFFVFTSDHGEMAGAHNIVGKGPYFYDETARVPLLIKWPGHVKRGCIIDRIVSFEDVMPTFCELTGASLPAQCRGRSLIPLLKEEGVHSEWREWTLMELYGAVFPSFALGLRSSRWLYVFRPFGGDELYDRVNDPLEMINLASKQNQLSLLKELRLLLVDILRQINHPMYQRVAVHINV